MTLEKVVKSQKEFLLLSHLPKKAWNHWPSTFNQNGKRWWKLISCILFGDGMKIKIPSEIYQPLIDLSSEPDKNMPGWAAQGTCIHSTRPLWPRRVASQRPVFKHHNFNVSSYEPLITNPENQTKQTMKTHTYSKLWFLNRSKSEKLVLRIGKLMKCTYE